MSQEASSTPEIPVISDPVSTPLQSLVSKRKLTSPVWFDFKKTVINGVLFAVCNYCKRKFSGESKSGTTHLKNHASRCLQKLNKLKGQLEINANLKEAADNLSRIQNFRFDHDRSRIDLCKMVMKHHYPFNMVEHELFNVFVNNLQPKFRMHSRNTLKSDCMKVYEAEKTNMLKILDELPSKISLTTDLWTCTSQNNAYLALTAHYIDDDWVLQKKLLCFPKVESKHDGQSLFLIIKNLILECNIDKKLFCMTVDNATSNDVMLRKLKTWLSDLSLLPLHGSLFHVRCASHILNLIVQDGLKSLDGLLTKIRESVMYVNGSPQRKHQFVLLLTQLRLHKLKQPGDDVPTRWNSTYLMLASAIAIKDAYSRLAQLDSRYTCNPTAREWEMGEAVCGCLKIFYDATMQLSGVQYPTSSIYFAIVCKIQFSLLAWDDHDEVFIGDMSRAMKLKFDKYWNESNLLMSLGVIFDPRFKLHFVEYYLNEIYGMNAQPEMIRIKDCLTQLFDEYNSVTPVAPTAASGSNVVTTSDVNVDCLLDFNNWYNGNRNVNDSAQTSELVKYLEEALVSGVDFNILSWWKDASVRFPTLGRMARDILAVPISTVASESSFSIGGNMIDHSRSLLGADVVQALMCGKDWIEVPGKVSRRSFPSSGAPLHP